LKKPHTTDLERMQLALEEAKKCGKDVPVGCVIVKDGVVIGIGRNERETTGDPTAHAEIQAIRQAAQKLGGWRLENTTIYSTLEPCPMCAEAIIQSRIQKLVFGAYDPQSGAAGSAFNLFCPGRIYPIPEIVGGLLEQECQNLLVEFFKASKR